MAMLLVTVIACISFEAAALKIDHTNTPPSMTYTFPASSASSLPQFVSTVAKSTHLSENDLTKAFMGADQKSQIASSQVRDHADPPAPPAVPVPPMLVLINKHYDVCYQAAGVTALKDLGWCVGVNSCVSTAAKPGELTMHFVPFNNTGLDCKSLGYDKYSMKDDWYPGNVWAFFNEKAMVTLGNFMQIMAVYPDATAYPDDDKAKAVFQCTRHLLRGYRTDHPECDPSGDGQIQNGKYD